MITLEEKTKFVAQLTDFDCYWLTLWGEFRGEPVEAQIAGAHVIFNRWLINKSQTIKEVCLKPYQFSCWNLSDSNLSKLIEVFEESKSSPLVKQLKFIAAGVMSSSLLDNTNGATNYLTVSLYASPLAPEWTKKMRAEKQYGKTIFLKV